MYSIRVTKTTSNADAVQVVYYSNRRTVVAAHIGSAHSREELTALKDSARQWITKATGRRALFPDEKPPVSGLVSLEKCRYLGIRYSFIYECLTKVFARFKFHTLGNTFLADLALTRIVEPSSLLGAIELMDELFAIRHTRQDFYRQLPHFSEWKEKVEAGVLALARREFQFDFSLVFYDVTTLYFESFKPDDLRKPGFSKDGKPNQPQILIGLMVNSQGFPVAYQIFAGNKFEGHTLIPTILAFKQSHKIDNLTIVADAAMISINNIQTMKNNGLSYIVGARISGLSSGLTQKICTELNRQDGKSVRIETPSGDLVCDFSLKRYRKDKSEMEKQLTKAEILLREPTKQKRTKFLKSTGKTSLELNKVLVEKTEKLLGIKGYYTNLTKVDNLTIIQRYHDLWHIEQAFRIAKSDLEVRPIYHFKKETIEAHVLICFMALTVCKYLEIRTGKPTKKIAKLLKSVTDVRIQNTLSGEEFIMRSDVSDEVKQILIDLDVSY